MKINVTKFKTHCTQILREIGAVYDVVEVTKRGQTVAVVKKPDEGKPHKPSDYAGSLRGTVIEQGDIVSPVVDPDEWEANQ